MYHEKKCRRGMYFSCKCFCFKQKTIIFATRPEYLYHTKRRKTGDRRADAPSPPIMDRETILPEMTDMKEPALAYTAVGEMTFCRPSTTHGRRCQSWEKKKRQCQ